MLAYLRAPLVILIFILILGIPVALGIALGLMLRRRINRARAAGSNAQGWAAKVVAVDDGLKSGSFAHGLDRKVSQLPPNAQARLVGAASLVCGLILALVGLLVPLVSAASQAPRISLWTKATIAAPLGIVFGLCYLLGDTGRRLVGPPGRPTPLGILVIVLSLAVGLVLTWCLEASLHAHGYTP